MCTGINSRSYLPVQSTVSGAISITAAVIISFTTVLIGEALTRSQIISPVLGEPPWPVSAALAIMFTLVATLFIMMVVLGLSSAIGTPKLYGWTEYTIIGAGGVVGTVSAALVSAAVWVTGTTALNGILPSGSGENVAALAAVALPMSYVFYEFYNPDMSPVTANNNNSEILDPEFVRQETERWSDHAAATPARQQGQSQLQNYHEQEDSQQTSASEPAISASITPNVTPDFSEMEYRWNSETDVSFDDVGGMHELKTELQRDVIKPLTTHRKKAEQLGVSAPNIIFHGPPGTGKTFMAKALATELGLPFAKLSGADIQSKWINESSQKVKTLFEEAKAVAKLEGGAVVFLDELDTVLKTRDGGGNTHEEDNKVVNEFLNHLEDTEKHNIVFVGATNRLESLDDAGIRSGRIDKKIYVGKPDGGARVAVLKAHLDRRPHELTDEDIGRAAAMTNGLVAADLELLVEEAAKQVLARDGKAIQSSDMMVTVRNTP